MTYADAGREVSLNFTTMYSNLTLASGLLAAILAVLGAGELFKSSSPPSRPSHAAIGIPTLSPVSLMILVFAFPLLLRFFARAMMSYDNLHRYNEIRKLAWQFLGGRSEWIDFSTNYYLYEIQWKSPKPLRRLVWATMAYGFFWLFAVFATAIAWGFYSTTGGCTVRLFAGVVLLVGVVWETRAMWASPIYSFSVPTSDDLSRARQDSELSLKVSKEKTELLVGGYAMVAALDYVQYGLLGIVDCVGSDVGLRYADDPDVYVFPRGDVVAVADPFK